MSDEPVPFPAAEANGDKKPRRRRGGVRRRKPRAGAEETRAALEPAPAAPPVIAAPAPSPVAPVYRDSTGSAASSASHSISASPLFPARSSVEQRLCIFIDFENIALGVRDAKYKKFDINLVLQRLIEKGRIVYKKAYADWTRYAEYKREFHEAAIELIDIPQRGYTGKNSADIRMVVDAMDLATSKGHITTFVICSGDSDFSPLVSKLKENDKSVIGIGVKNSTSDLLISNCDEFIFYEDLVRETRALPS
ncbi:MAG: NYN domain-containing protein, partial [Acidobacteriota bacterium]